MLHSIEHFELYDFLMDESFQKWIQHPEPEVEHFWKMMLEANPDKKPLAETAIRIIQSAQYKDLQFDQQENRNAWEKISKHTFNKDIAIARNSHKRWKFLIKAAVVLLPLAMVTLFFLFSKKEQITEKVAQAKPIEKITKKGQKLQIILADGSKVLLNAESKLVYTQPFSKDKREVFLVGEAFFEVEHDRSKPFIVHAGNLSTKVLGTSFNIRTYPQEQAIEVAVVTGKVMVENGDAARMIQAHPPVLLQPSEMITYDKKALTTKVSKVDINPIIAWSENILIFDNARFSQVVEQLERWYGVKFIIERKQPIKKGFSGSFKNQPLENVLEGIGYTSDFQYQIERDTVIIK